MLDLRDVVIAGLVIVVFLKKPLAKLTVKLGNLLVTLGNKILVD